MVSIVVAYCNSSDINIAISIVERAKGTVLPTVGYTQIPSLVVFYCNQDAVGSIVDKLSNKVTSINKISEIRNVEKPILNYIKKPSDTIVTKDFTGIIESKGIEAIISSASTVMHTDGIQMHHIYLSNNPFQYSMYVFSGDKDIVEKTLNSAKTLLESTKRVMGNYETGD